MSGARLGAPGAALGLLLVAGLAQACELPPGTRVESGRLAVSYRTLPQKIAVGQHFVLELDVCARQGPPPAGRVRLDAHMPEHRHGMNYEVRVTPIGATRFRSEGWMFHMPGRWEFIFELGAERLTHAVRVE